MYIRGFHKIYSRTVGRTHVNHTKNNPMLQKCTAQKCRNILSLRHFILIRHLVYSAVFWPKELEYLFFCFKRGKKYSWKAWGLLSSSTLLMKTWKATYHNQSVPTLIHTLHTGIYTIPVVKIKLLWQFDFPISDMQQTLEIICSNILSNT